MSEVVVRTRKRGFRIDGAALDLEMTARGLQGDQLAHAAGVSEDTISKARRGIAVDVATLHKIVDALEKIPARPMLAKLAGSGASIP